MDAKHPTHLSDMVRLSCHVTYHSNYKKKTQDCSEWQRNSSQKPKTLIFGCLFYSSIYAHRISQSCCGWDLSLLEVLVLFIYHSSRFMLEIGSKSKAWNWVVFVFLFCFLFWAVNLSLSLSLFLLWCHAHLTMIVLRLHSRVEGILTTVFPNTLVSCHHHDQPHLWTTVHYRQPSSSSLIFSQNLTQTRRFCRHPSPVFLLPGGGWSSNRLTESRRSSRKKSLLVISAANRVFKRRDHDSSSAATNIVRLLALDGANVVEVCMPLFFSFEFVWGEEEEMWTTTEG